jgi:hypothetical protein
MNIIIVPVFLLLTILSETDATTLNKVLFDLNKYPLARCNDGTPSGYYYKASTSGSKDFLIFQEGGGWSYSTETCKGRSSVLSSSKDWTNTVTQSGIFESQDPKLSQLNLIYVPYCTSDGWIGSTVTNENECNFFFNGKDVVTAVIEEAVSTLDLGSTTNTKVMYGGCSAGARGALFNIDRVETLLNTLVPGKVSKFGGLLDSCLWVDIPQLNTSKQESFQNQTAAVVILANATASIPDDCASKYPDALWKCLFGEYRLPFVKSDYFLHSYQYDLFQLQGDTGVVVPNVTPEELAYDETFRAKTLLTANEDTINPNVPGTAALLPACFKHCNTQTSTFSSLMTNGVSLEMAVSSWFYESKSVPQYITESCKGFNCGADCPKP